MTDPATDRDVDIVICGTCVADIPVRPVPLGVAIGGSRLFHVEPIDVTLGGIVCNTGTALTRLGMRVAATSLVGNDIWGREVRARLDAEGIDTSGLVAHPSLATSTTAALIDPSGERSFAHHVGVCGAIDLAFIRGQLPRFARGRWAVLGYVGLLPGLEPALAEAVAALKAVGCLVALETAGSGGTLEGVAASLPHVDCYVPSLDEAVHQTGLANPRAIIDCYRVHGARGLVGVKLGTRGAMISPQPGSYLDIPCLPAPAPVADTTGAGDAFLAGLITGLVRGQPAREAALLGAAAAAWCVTGVGGTSGLRSFDETQRLIR
jgi:sugar/nucleoside kinase (ribokinase family)